MKYEVPPFLSGEGRHVPFIHIAKRTPGAKEKLRVYIQAAIHGNEPAADQAVMALLGKMDANTTWAASLLDKMEILVQPRCNSDGVYYFQRELAENLDTNRDHSKLAIQQTRDMKRRITKFQPHVTVDVHEFAANPIFAGYRQGLDAMLGSCADPNTHLSIRNIGENLFLENIEKDVKPYGIRARPCVLGTQGGKLRDPIAFKGITIAPMGLEQGVFVLLETRGQFLAGQHFQRRVATQLIMLESILNTARNNADQIVSTINAAVKTFISSNDPVVLTGTAVNTTFTCPLIDVTDGFLKELNVTYTGPASIPDATRARPEAYLIPRNWFTVAEKLRIMGVEVRELASGYSGTVTAYSITSSKLGTALYEGVVQNKLIVEPIKRQISLVPGSFRVSTRQKNAAFAFVGLEPDHQFSFASFGAFPLDTRYEYPIFREERK